MSVFDELFPPRQLKCEHVNPHGQHYCTCSFILYEGQQIPHFHCSRCSAIVLLWKPISKPKKENENELPQNEN